MSSLLMKSYKDSLLLNTPSPRIIFVGGSNVSFGLNSQMIKDSLGLNPINTAISAGLGLAYMMDNTAKFIRQGDIVVLAPEYSHFYGDELYGSEPLLRTCLYSDELSFSDLRLEQKVSVLKKFLPYLFSKFQPIQYINVPKSGIYTKKAYNKYGDVDCHWQMEQQVYTNTDTIVGAYEPVALQLVQEFEAKVKARGGRLFLTFPSYQYSTFVQDRKEIKFLEEQFKQSGLSVLGSAERYAFPDSMMFNTCYHLLKEGLDLRTQYLIEDLTDFRQREAFIYFEF